MRKTSSRRHGCQIAQRVGYLWLTFSMLVNRFRPVVFF
jgi:hypothetical protein